MLILFVIDAVRASLCPTTKTIINSLRPHISLPLCFCAWLSINK